MNIEDLLKPRYRVIAIYPFNDHFMLNEIITLNEFDGRIHLSENMKEHYVVQQPLNTTCYKLPVTMYESTFKKYPHLFEPVPWYAERAVEDMPEYIQYGTQAVYKVRWDFSENNLGYIAWAADRDDYPLPLQSHVHPVTEEEYLTYQSKQKQ